MRAKLRRRYAIPLLLCTLAACIPLSDCQDCGFNPGERVRLGYPLPCDVCRRTVVADANGCIVYPHPDTSTCTSVSKIGLGSFSFFFASPSFIDLQAPPASITINGGGISTAHGMPKIQFYNEYESLVYETTASSVAGDGTWLEVVTPDLSGVEEGSYNIEVSNINADASTTIIGVLVISTYNAPPPCCDEYGTCTC